MNTWKEMETRSAVPVRTLNVKQRCNFGSSGIFPSSLPVMANTFVERFPKLSDPQQVPMETEMMGDVLAFQYTPFVSNGGNIGPMYLSPSGISPDHFSSVLSHERNRDNAPFVRQLGNAEVSLPSAYSPYTETFQVPINNLSNDPTEVTWCPDSVQGSINYSHDEITGTTQSRQIVVPDDDLNTQDEWWSGVTNEDWKELLKDTIAAESQLQVVYPNPTSTTPLGISVYGSHNHQSIPRHSNELGAVTSQLPAATTAARPRMRWSLELHERFVDAVNQLGGSEKATPKGILNIMKVEGLTICHVKSHLQKFRTACYRPHPSEGLPEKKTTESEDLPFLNLKTGMDFTEALRIQMEVQKRLHEQLEEQRELQLQIEKQGRYLQKIIEKQCKSTMEKFHASSTMEEPTTDETASAAKVVHPAAGTSCSIDSNITEGRQVGDKRKMPEFEPSVDNETNVITAPPPQHKHAKISNGDNDDELQQQLAID